jgi:iron complex outermembrane receptor protein
VAGVAPATVNAGLDLSTKPGIYLNAVYSYRDPIYITSDNANRASSFALLHAKIGYRHVLSKHIDANLYAGANNIAGIKYYNMVFINQVPDIYLPGPDKINYFGGINIKYCF